MIKAFKAAFPHTLPVLAGYMFLGVAFGILMNSKGYGLGWAVLMSAAVYAGSAQYAAITFLTSIFNPLNALLLTLMINARHLFYGISMLEKYQGAGRLKPYLVFGLTDETFSILVSAEPPPGIGTREFQLAVTLLDHGYWVLGSALGALLGNFITFNTTGLDFVLTALFVMIFTGQWKSQTRHSPAVIGVLCTVACLVLFGPERFIIPSMAAIVLMLTVFKENIADEGTP